MEILANFVKVKSIFIVIKEINVAFLAEMNNCLEEISSKANFVFGAKRRKRFLWSNAQNLF